MPEQDSKAVTMSPKAHRIVTRAAKYVLVDVPLCRKELRALPNLLKLLATFLVTNVRQLQQIARRLLLVVIYQTKNTYLQAYRVDEWKRKKRHDSLQWVTDAAPDEAERNPRRLMYQVLHINLPRSIRQVSLI